MSADAERFFSILFRGAPADSFITISAPLSSDRNSAWKSEHVPISNIGAAVDAALGFDAEGLNAYVGLGARASDLGKWRRGAKDDVVGLGCIWLDLDVGAVGHASENCPPDTDAASTIVKALDAEPSMIVDSGGGWHVYWMTDTFCTDVERVARLCASWQRRAISFAEARGWSLDFTGDAARVLRVPGTHNRKGGAKKPVTLCL